MTKERDKLGAAVVTGARRGLGRAIAMRLAAQGHGIVVCDATEDGLDETVKRIEAAGGRAAAVRADVSDEQAMRDVVARATETFGPLRVAVNNAAIPPPIAAFHEIDGADWRRNIDVNLNGVFYGMKYQIAAMREAGGGAIVNISSMAARISVPGSHVYSVAKRGVLAMTACAAIENAAAGIRVNAILPGYMAGELADEVKAVNPDMAEHFRKTIPMMRFGEPHEVAELAAFLASDASSYITGQDFACDGGSTA